MKIQNKTTPGGYSEVKLARDTTQNSIVLTGSTGEAPGGGTIPVHDPPLFATSCFGKIIQDEGIYISGRVRTIDPQNSKYSYKSFIPLCTHESPSLFEIAKPLNKESDNFLSQQVFRTLGAELKGKGSLKNSEAVIREFMEKAGIATEGLSMADGCGLSNFNRVTPRQLAEVLEYMYSHREGKKFMATLPKAGVDGTLKYRLAGTKVVAKTGTINENSSLSGYVTTQAGQVLVFSIISNNHTLGQGFYKDMEDRIVNTLARWNKEL
jgi:D-alanyl-D-alanine carboxypeptidase/D-alanyl-D-alanine-endopeptidase (penicillin-binding protein 4)